MSTSLRSAIEELYRQVEAPDWASPNLDGLADVLRDLSWLPPGEVTVRVPAGAPDRVLSVLDAAVAESAGRSHPITLEIAQR